MENKLATEQAAEFYFPAEWEEHEFTIMVMPPPQNWKGFGVPIKDVREQWARVANKLSEYERVLMVVRLEDKLTAKAILNSKIELVEFPVNDGWARDSGPMFLVNGKGQRRVAGFKFNGWGGKFPPFDDDAALKMRLCKHLEVEVRPIDFVLEGGAVACDGQGTLLTTEQCLLHKNRNTVGDQVGVEKVLNQSLGTTKVIWIGKGLEPDPITDGHVDGIAAFAGPGTVLLHTTEDKGDRNYKICQDAMHRLQDSTDAKGRKLEVVEVPLDADLSHINFYIANRCVMVPVTARRQENERPLAILRDLFPKHDVVGIDSTVLARGGGGIHCITQQVPRV